MDVYPPFLAFCSFSEISPSIRTICSRIIFMALPISTGSKFMLRTIGVSTDDRSAMKSVSISDGSAFKSIDLP